MKDIISVQGIEQYLEKQEDFGQILVFDSLKSTNDTAKELIKSGDSPHVSVIIAEHQTAGRGRYGRSFFSPPGHGIYMSLILPWARLQYDTPALITAFAAVVVCQAIEALTNKAPKIKPVNDILLADKKICGILTESVSGFIIIGIGINFCTPSSNFPDELKQKAGSLFPDGCAPITRNRLISEILIRIFDPKNPLDSNDVQNQYKSHLFE